MVGFDKNSSVAKVNKVLKSKYGFELKNVEFSLREIMATLNLTNKERNISHLEREINQLCLIRKRLIKQLDNFMKTSKRWDKLKLKLQHDAPWTEEEKIDFFKQEFGLESFLEKIDLKVNHLKKSVLLLSSLRTRIAGEKKLIQPHTLAILVWIIAMQSGRDKRYEKYATVITLLEWLSKHRRALLKETIGQERKYLTPPAVRRDYERYISKPDINSKVYSEIADSIYAESFFEHEY